MDNHVVTWSHKRVENEGVGHDGAGSDQDIVLGQPGCSLRGVEVREVLPESLAATNCAIGQFLRSGQDVDGFLGRVFSERLELLDRDRGTASLGDVVLGRVLVGIHPLHESV